MGYFLLWPLTHLLWQDYLTAAQPTWVKGRLEYMGTELGIMFGMCLGQVPRWCSVNNTLFPCHTRANIGATVHNLLLLSVYT